MWSRLYREHFIMAFPSFDAATSRTILDKWRHTNGGPAQDFLKGWTPASLVVSVDLDVINKGGTMLAVWGGEMAIHAWDYSIAGAPLPQGVVYLPLCLGGALICVFALEQIIRPASRA